MGEGASKLLKPDRESPYTQQLCTCGFGTSNCSTSSEEVYDDWVLAPLGLGS